MTCLIFTVSWYVQLRPEAAAVGGHGLCVAVQLAHGEGVVGLEVVVLWEGVHAVGLVGVRHPLHLVDLYGHAGGFVRGQTKAIFIWSGYRANITLSQVMEVHEVSTHYGS